MGAMVTLRTLRVRLASKPPRFPSISLSSRYVRYFRDQDVDRADQCQNEGFEESVFLGAQVAAKVLFVQDQGVSNGFMSRVQYNDLGPSGIHEVGLAF